MTNTKIAILATGDEITQGSVLNTNARIIAQELFSHGLEPEWHMAVSDETDAIEEALDFLLQRHAVVITIGGLGPTSDDKTRFALANYLKEPLVLHQPSLESLTTRYQQFNLPFTELSRQQALFPRGAEILENKNGSANGCVYSNVKNIFMLPGPPRECLPMFETHVLPRLINQYATGKELLQWKVFGIAEGIVAEKVDVALKPYAEICRTSFRWDYPYVDCKVLLDTNAPEKQPIITTLNEVLLPYQVDPIHNQTASEQLKNYLIQAKEPVFIQDFATAGTLESRVHVPANHATVFFGVASSTENFFHIDGLKNYWHGEEGTQSELILTSQQGVEIFQIPYRGALLEVYAAEFVAHQIFLQLCQ